MSAPQATEDVAEKPFVAGDESPPSIGDDSQTKAILPFDEKEERRLVRKVDIVVMPIVSILYLLSFLDRSNIGNAKIEGMVTDLRITDYTSLLTIYFVGYVLAELPANWILKVSSPPLWLPTMTLLWGIVSVCMGLVHNQAGMFAVRFFLGITEAGLFPGCVYIFSRFYKRSERTARVAFFFSAASASGAFGGVLAYGLSQMDGVGGKRGWQWIFILEGLLTIVVSFLAYFIVPNYPHQSNKFTAREKEIIEARLRSDSDALDTEGFSWKEVWRAFTTAQVYGYCFLFHGFSFGLYTLSLFLPSIIQGLGYKSWQAQLLTVPPYVFAFIVTMSLAIITQRVKIRAPFIIGAAFVSILGYIVLITSPTIGGKYV
jgi:MFS family permease